jgi:type I restriction enzyme R subunit
VYLKRIADLVKKVQSGQAEDTPEKLDTPGRRALFNNLRAPVNGAKTKRSAKEEDAPPYRIDDDGALELALKIDETVKVVRPDGWRGVQARERVIKGALYDILKDEPTVERVFVIIKQHKEY